MNPLVIVGIAVVAGLATGVIKLNNDTPSGVSVDPAAKPDPGKTTTTTTTTTLPAQEPIVNTNANWDPAARAYYVSPAGWVSGDNGWVYYNGRSMSPQARMALARAEATLTGQDPNAAYNTVDAAWTNGLKQAKHILGVPGW